MTRLTCTLTAAALALALAAVAHAKTYDVPAALGASLERADDQTPLAILLPSRLALDYDGRTFASGSGGRRSYSLSLAAARNCGGATRLLPRDVQRASAAPRPPSLAGSPCAAVAPAASSR